MRVKKVNSNQIILNENTQVKLKIAGNIRGVQFSAGVNKKCPIKNMFIKKGNLIYQGTLKQLHDKYPMQGTLEKIYMEVFVAE